MAAARKALEGPTSRSLSRPVTSRPSPSASTPSATTRSTASSGRRATKRSSRRARSSTSTRSGPITWVRAPAWPASRSTRTSATSPTWRPRSSPSRAARRPRRVRRVRLRQRDDLENDPAKPVGINPKGSAKKDSKGISVDGILPDDQRRSGSAFPTYACENYVQQALGEIVGTAFIVRAVEDPDVFDLVRRRDQAGVPEPDRRRLRGGRRRRLDVRRRRLPRADDLDDGFAPGKSFGWVDWLYG